MDNKPMLNAYPDSMGNRLGDTVSLLKRDEFKDVFRSFYILPSVFHSDLDRGFSVIDYNINNQVASAEDFYELKKINISLKLDFILNHLSVQSPQFEDLLKNGETSEYKDFFMDWNKFWQGSGEMTDEGYIKPYDTVIKDMFFRKPGLPLLMVRFENGDQKPYWNTFYQEIKYDEKDKSKCTYLGQMDLNIKSPLVWNFYDETLKKLSSYGAEIIRLDAFAYASKSVGAKNFLNEPDTWELLEKIKPLAEKYNLTLLPEIHAQYDEHIHEKICSSECITYDFFLPGLLIHAIEKHTYEYLIKWIDDIRTKNLKVINMLGCHDGIPLLDLKGLIPDSEIDEIIKLIQRRGGFVKNFHHTSEKGMYYQVNATYYSALGENDKKFLFSRAIQIFMPGKPQIWYLDLFAGRNDYDAVKKADKGGHKEINRTNLSLEQINKALHFDLVRKQLELIKFRNTSKAFDSGSCFKAVLLNRTTIKIEWKNNGNTAMLIADIKDYSFTISETNSEHHQTINLYN